MAELVTIADRIAQIKADRNTIRSAMQRMGLASATDKLSTLATKLDGVDTFDGLEYSVKQGEPFTIPKGYHTGGTTVIGLDNPEIDANTYNRTTVTGVKPKKELVTVTTPAGYYAMSSVSIDPIPDNYQDISDVTATQEDVLPTKMFVTQQGELKYGTMPNNGAINYIASVLNTKNELGIPKGYHDGNGKVSWTVESKTVTPSESTQTISSTSTGFLSYVTVNPIPSNYIDKTDEDVAKTEADITVTDATVTVPAGYYAANASKTVTTVDREDTTLTSTKKGNSFELVASNNQPKGFSPGGDKTATKTVTLTMSGGTATMSDGSTNVISLSATPAQRAETRLDVQPDDEDSSLIYISASNNQGVGYIETASNKTAVKYLKMSASGKTVSVTDTSGETVYGSADVDNITKLRGSINGLSTTTFTQTVNKFVESIEVILTNDIENELAAI